MLENEDISPDEESFQKIRRNLVAASVIVIIYKVGGLSLKTFELFGNKFSILNQDVVVKLLWIFLIYFSMRYFTAFNNVNGGGTIKSEFNDFIADRLQKVIKKELRAKSVDGVVELSRYLRGSRTNKRPI